MVDSFKRNFVDRLRQFGFWATLRQFLDFIVRALYTKRKSVVLISESHAVYSECFEGAREITDVLVDDALQRGMLPQKNAELFKRFLFAGCKGFWIEQDGKICGHAFLQLEGIYSFGQTGSYRLPPDTAMLKNLEVYSAFRGRGIGPQLVRLRLNAVPAGYVPMIFVNHDNRYALRNLLALGFEPILQVTRRTWCRRWTRQTVCFLKETALTRRLAEGFEK